MTNVKRKVIESATEMTLQKREIRFSLRAVPAFALLWLAPLHAQSSPTRGLPQFSCDPRRYRESLRDNGRRRRWWRWGRVRSR
jgi:hypothetical protein